MTAPARRRAHDRDLGVVLVGLRRHLSVFRDDRAEPVGMVGQTCRGLQSEGFVLIAHGEAARLDNRFEMWASAAELAAHTFYPPRRQEGMHSMREPLISKKTEWQETRVKASFVMLHHVEGRSGEVRLTVGQGTGPFGSDHRETVDLTADDCRILAAELERTADRLAGGAG